MHRPVALAISASVRSFALLFVCLTWIACSGAAAPAPQAAQVSASGTPLRPLPPAEVLVSEGSALAADGSAGGASPSASAASASVPVSSADPQRGPSTALVTVVEFSDFQCPFCSRVTPTLKQLEAAYSGRVRFVFKHNPLPFHNRARPAAEAAATVFGLGGSRAFFEFYSLAFGHQLDLSDENFAAWARTAGVDVAQFRAAYAAKKFANKVDEDIALAKKVGANGTPGFRINGVTVSGAQPLDKFKEVIDQQLAEAEKLVAAGTPRADVYAVLTNKNQALTQAPDQAPEPSKRGDEDDDSAVWKVPVLPDDPVRGPKDALVTVLVFSDYQCPFCKRVEDTLKQVADRYGKDVRFVWKDNPLPFHPRARPAAEFARFVLSRKGEAGFWAAHDALFESQPKLDEEDLEIISVKLGVPWNAAKQAIAQNRFRARIDASIEQASDFEARGTPHFFINGVRLSGAQPFEKFQGVIDAQLARAKTLVEEGVPRARLYAALIEDGKGPEEPATVEIAAPDATTPVRGNPQAKVLIQEFSDFQCPFCKRVQPTLSELEKEFRGQIRVAYRHLPLPFHQHAALAAEAAQEAFAQKGNAGFWAFHDELFDAQAESEGLERPHLEEIAKKLGLDLARFRAALDSRKHEPKAKADSDLASRAGINGTPSFAINGYQLSGAMPAAAFRKLIKKALLGGPPSATKKK
ncbi:MAG TPA: thioredoxin domain-containing protein [Polyangiaceae bacterium]|nr:thioredoxin domain-containing protein [Polyangiaceae bacterium]